MLARRTLMTLALLVAVYLLLLAPALVWPSYLDSPIGVLAAAPLLSIYFFHQVGIPGLLEHDGLCGWGWCAPTMAGWALAGLFWLGLAWGLSWGLAALAARPCANS